MGAEETDPLAEYEVVVNDEEQYSVWPSDQAVPAGWRAVGVRGPLADCLRTIDQRWTDMRPRSLRESMAQHGGQDLAS